MISPLPKAQPAPKPLLIPSSLVSKSIAISVAPVKSLYSDGEDQICFLKFILSCKPPIIFYPLVFLFLDHNNVLSFLNLLFYLCLNTYKHI